MEKIGCRGSRQRFRGGSDWDRCAPLHNNKNSWWPRGLVRKDWQGWIIDSSELIVVDPIFENFCWLVSVEHGWLGCAKGFADVMQDGEIRWMAANI